MKLEFEHIMGLVLLVIILTISIIMIGSAFGYIKDDCAIENCAANARAFNEGYCEGKNKTLGDMWSDCPPVQYC